MKVRLKRYYDYKTNYDIVRFNSMKVRLKLVSLRLFADNMKFQFHEGPIKTYNYLIHACKVERFNSMKVRLKPGYSSLSLSW